MIILKIARRLLGYVLLAVLSPIGWVLGRLVPKRKNLIVLEGTARNRYNENSRYLLEYLATKPELEVYWFTEDAAISRYLKSTGLRPLYGLLEKLFVLCRAGMVVGTGSIPLNFYSSVGPKTKKYCLMHGIGPKVTIYFGREFEMTLKELRKVHSFDYVNFTSPFTIERVGKIAYKIPYDKTVANGYPRNDHLFDRASAKKKQLEKPWSHSIFKELGDRAKVLLYTPTWRIENNALPLFELPGFDLVQLYSFLERNDLYLVYSRHPKIVAPVGFVHPRIYYLDYSVNKTVDLNLVYPEVDLLLNDYSTTSTDFAILDRPQIFVMPDYDEYLRNDCFLEDYRAIMPGVEAFSFVELQRLITELLNKPENDQGRRSRYLKKYYDFTSGDSCCRNYEFIKKVLA
jgi:CDP-glycerol glycerophosphotransferase